MSEPNDKLLHDWVRQTLEPYRPDYNPSGWEPLRQRLKRRRFWPWIILGLAVLLISSLAIRGFRTIKSNQETLVTENNRLSKTINSSLKTKAEQPATRRKTAFNTPIKEQTKKPFRTISLNQATDFQTHQLSVPVFEPQLIPIRSVIPVVDFPKTPNVSPIQITPLQEVVIRQQMLSGSFGADSTSYQTLTRNSRRWPNTVLVCDFTSSMYPYSTQLFAWMKKYARNPTINGTVVFTDCDSLGQETRPGGPAGQIFVTSERDPAKALPVLLEASRNTVKNQNEAENDIEALLFAQKAFPDARHLVLIADIDNPVKDMALLDQIQKPVHVILCGRDWDTTQAFHPDYYTIARRTNGSLHTLEDDVDPAQLKPTTWLRVGSRYYRYHRGRERFVLTKFRHRPERLLGLLWW